MSTVLVHGQAAPYTTLPLSFAEIPYGLAVDAAGANLFVAVEGGTVAGLVAHFADSHGSLAFTSGLTGYYLIISTGWR